jgi:hypothetical protein
MRESINPHIVIRFRPVSYCFLGGTLYRNGCSGTEVERCKPVYLI